MRRVAAVLVAAAWLAAGVAQAADDPLKVLLFQKNWSAVERLARDRLAADPKDAGALLALGRLPLARQDEAGLDDAIRTLAACVEAAPDFADCHTWYGQALAVKVVRGNLLEKIRYAPRIRGEFERAVELAPNALGTRFALQEYYLLAPGIIGGSRAKAQEQVALMARANAAYGRMLQAVLDLHDGRLAQAESAVGSVAIPAELDAADIQRDLMVNIGNSYLRGGQAADGRRVYEAMTRRYPAESTAWLGLGRSLQEQGRLDDALPILEKAFALQPDAVPLLRIAQIHQARGDREKAIAYLERAVAFRPALSGRQMEDARARLQALRG